MRLPTLLIALVVTVGVLPGSSSASDLAGTRLVCSGTTFEFNGPMDVSGWIIELGDDGEAFVQGVNNRGRMHYEYSDTEVSLDWPARCSFTNASRGCEYYGRIGRADGGTALVHRRSDGSEITTFSGSCVPFKSLF